jgi:hypothetical protein
MFLLNSPQISGPMERSMKKCSQLLPKQRESDLSEQSRARPSFRSFFAKEDEQAVPCLAGSFYTFLLSHPDHFYLSRSKMRPHGAACSNRLKNNELRKSRKIELSQNFPIDGATVRRSIVLTKI